MKKLIRQERKIKSNCVGVSQLSFGCSPHATCREPGLVMLETGRSILWGGAALALVYTRS